MPPRAKAAAGPAVTGALPTRRAAARGPSQADEASQGRREPRGQRGPSRRGLQSALHREAVRSVHPPPTSRRPNAEDHRGAGEAQCEARPRGKRLALKRLAGPWPEGARRGEAPTSLGPQARDCPRPDLQRSRCGRQGHAKQARKHTSSNVQSNVMNVLSRTHRTFQTSTRPGHCPERCPANKGLGCAPPLPIKHLTTPHEPFEPVLEPDDSVRLQLLFLLVFENETFCTFFRNKSEFPLPAK